MRCADVTRELAAPTTGADLTGLAHHLDHCPSCAKVAEAARHLDQIWAQTRPAEPSPAAWERFWARVGADDAPATLPLVRPDSRRRWVVPVLTVAVVAQAAAILIAVGILLRRNDIGATGPVHRPIEVAQSQDFEFRLDADQTLILTLDESGAGPVVCEPRFVSTDELVAFDPEEGVPAPDIAYQGSLALLNYFEGME